jgi:inhibitor of cysteine peptidase
MAMKKMFAVLAALFLLVLMACSSGSDNGDDTTNPKTYNITGQITSNSTGLAGVTVALSDTTETTTDSSGNYSFTVESNGDYTVSPSLSGYVFSPSGTVVTISHTDIAGIDFTATASTTTTYSISGTVGGAVASGVTVTLAGTSSGSTLTDSSGNYSFSDVANGNYTITASKTGYTFSPVFSITINGANITGQNFTATANVAPSSEKAFETFSLGAFTGTINEAAKTIAVIVPLGTNVTALIATFTITGESVSIGSTVQTNGQTPNDFTNPVVYTVKAADASTVPYTVTVTLNQLATAVNISMTANTPGAHAGIFCTATKSITGTIDVTDINGGTNIEWEWYDNGVLLSSGSTTLVEANGHYTTTFYGAATPPAPEPFQYHHTIMFKVNVDGGETNGGVSAVTSQRIL